MTTDTAYNDPPSMLTRKPAHEKLKRGDAYSFLSLTDQQMQIAKETGVGGRTSRWFDTSQPVCIFQIVQIHEQLHAVETVYLGFEVEPGTKRVEGDPIETTVDN